MLDLQTIQLIKKLNNIPDDKQIRNEIKEIQSKIDQIHLNDKSI
jgi:hypothetical protein